MMEDKMAQAFDEDNNLIAEAQAESLREAFKEILNKAPEAKKIIVKELTLEERVENLEVKLQLLINRGGKLK